MRLQLNTRKPQEVEKKPVPPEGPELMAGKNPQVHTRSRMAKTASLLKDKKQQRPGKAQPPPDKQNGVFRHDSTD